MLPTYLVSRSAIRFEMAKHQTPMNHIASIYTMTPILLWHLCGRVIQLSVRRTVSVI